MGRLPGSFVAFLLHGFENLQDFPLLNVSLKFETGRLEASLDTNEMKELFKAIDLDISEAHCASWRLTQKCLIKLET